MRISYQLVAEQTGNTSAATDESAVPGLTDFGSVSFEDAVKLFQHWGFQVEPGPRPGEVTLILEGPDHRVHSVHDAGMLPQMAAVALRVRWLNGTLTRGHQGGWQGPVNSDFAELLC